MAEHTHDTVVAARERLDALTTALRIRLRPDQEPLIDDLLDAATAYHVGHLELVRSELTRLLPGVGPAIDFIVDDITHSVA